MTIAIRHRPMTRETFLAWIGSEGGRWEFDGFQPVAMTGGTNNHGIISGNIYFGLRQRLGGKPCRPTTGESGGVATAGNKVRHPNATVTCSPVPGTEQLIPAPVVVFEVVSPSSERDDHHEKAREYQALPSVMRYVVVEQDRKEMRVLHCDGDGTWRESRLHGGDPLDMPEIGVSLPLDEIYEGVFPTGWLAASRDDWPAEAAASPGDGLCHGGVPC